MTREDEENPSNYPITDPRNPLFVPIFIMPIVT